MHAFWVGFSKGYPMACVYATYGLLLPISRLFELPPRMLPVSPPAAGFPHPLLCQLPASSHHSPAAAAGLSTQPKTYLSSRPPWASSLGWAWPSAGSPSPPCLGSTCSQGSRCAKKSYCVKALMKLFLPGLRRHHGQHYG